MLVFAGWLLSAVLLAQRVPENVVAGMVIDEQGKPIAGAQVVLYGPPTQNFKGNAIEGQSQSDGGGRFDFKAPPLDRIYTNGVHVWAFKDGLAVGAVQYRLGHQHSIVLRKHEPRTVRVEGPDGKPIAARRIEAATIYLSGGTGRAEFPSSLAAPLAVSTGPDGTAALHFLRGSDRLVAARVTSDAIGEQDLSVTEETPAGAAQTVFAIKIKKTTRLTGRIVDPSGRGVAGQAVEIWSRRDSARNRPNIVGFKESPLRTRPDGVFQTPENLLFGISYRVVVREPGYEPIISDFFPVTDESVKVPPLELRALRTVSGKVIDRQGKPVANVEVFQSGDGPQRTGCWNRCARPLRAGRLSKRHSVPVRARRGIPLSRPDARARRP